MKLVITENRLERIAFKFLDKEFDDITEKESYFNSSTGVNTVTEYIKGSNIVMAYGHIYHVLYVSEDIEDIIIQLFADSELNKEIIKNWFQNKFRLPVKIIRIVESDKLNR
jgi:hypothetical protein